MLTAASRYYRLTPRSCAGDRARVKCNAARIWGAIGPAVRCDDDQGHGAAGGVREQLHTRAQSIAAALFAAALTRPRLAAFQFGTSMRCDPLDWKVAGLPIGDRPGRLYDFPERTQRRYAQRNDTWGRIVPVDVLAAEAGMKQEA
jgi:hypothetical protein